MIDTRNLKNVLDVIGFSEVEENIYEKKFNNNVFMRVDFAKKQLYFPDLIKGRNRNNGFNKNENFVVFECVNRLLEKGYKPEDIELEKEWHLGHDAKSGRADICVTGEDGAILFIIECKTWGNEFSKARKNTETDGGQLFSYWQQEGACKWLALYASDFDSEKREIKYNAPVISCSDDANTVLTAKNDKNTKLYRDANTVPEKYNVWKYTYNSHFYDDLIFSEDSVAYKIGVKPLRKKDLKAFSTEDKIVNKFEEILRHNNVSDKENAFNRLIAMFICKLVDEKESGEKGEDKEVEFQYKQGTDTYESLQDRLQKLHHKGMKDFMNEEVFYLPEDYPKEFFDKYDGADRQNAIDDLKENIRKLKFYTNNDFAFKDVHNEELFYQNGKILVEMVQLFEKYKIIYPSKDQLLGDLFEQLLNKGFKQNEGQFFTPMPITRFIWDCLPVEKFIKSELPRIIDYACGAGHFLTEAVEAVNYFNKNKNSGNSWARDYIYGIEKDYRLARVAKISLFMNGAGDGNIIFGDGLENAPDKGIKDCSFDILVSNPPYSIKDFKQHLQLNNNENFKLLDKISFNGSEIETLFVERIAQLLRPHGIAAVILPSSILSNTNRSYIGAREELLRNFYIRAIAAFGSKTFGATGTNTVIIFLEKFNDTYNLSKSSEDSVNVIFKSSISAKWRDREILEAYTSQIEVEPDNYIKFINQEYSINGLCDIEYFKMYVDDFEKSTQTRDFVASAAYQKMSSDEQYEAYLDKFYEYAHGVEREKLLYFAVTRGQTTVIINAPADNKGQKEFLGYDWSNSKGNEGIQISKRGGKMYDNADRSADGTLAAVIRKSFNEAAHIMLNDDQKKYAAVVNTKDMLDFSRVNFNKTIRLSVDKAVELRSKYSLYYLGQVCDIQIGGTPSRKNPNYFTGNNLWVSIAEMQGQIINDTKEKITDQAVAESNVKLISAGTTLLSFKLSIGKTAIAGRDLYTNEAIAALIPLDKSKILDKYLFYLFKGKFIELEKVGNKAFGKSLNSAYLREEIKIPVPPLSIQQQIVAECAKVDEEYEQTRMSIESYRKKIEEIFNELDVIATRNKLSLANSSKFDVSIGKRVLRSQLVMTGEIPVYSANVLGPFGYIDELLITDFSVPSVLWGIDGDWMTNYMPENLEFYPTDHCGVLRCKTSEVNPRYMAHILDVEGEKMGFSRAYRASIDRIQGITFTVPERVVQDAKIANVNALEEKIKHAEEKLKSLSGKTAEILEKYLN